MLTDVQIQKLGKPATRREVPDGKVTGLYLVVQPTGVKSWALRYRVNGKPAKLTLGPYPTISLSAARGRAQEALGKVAGGNNPAAEKRAAREAAKSAEDVKDRVENVAASFVDKYVKRNVGDGWAKEAERIVNRNIIPALGKKRLGDVKKSDVHDMLDSIVDRGSPIIANRTLAVFRRMCNWAIERGVIDRSPVDGVKAPSAENSRDRVLSDDEIKLAWQAFETVGQPFGAIGKLLLLTGARRDEIAAARWSEIDLAGRTLTIAKERSKNGIAHEIPLSDDAVEIIEGVKRIEAKRGPPAYLFSTTGSTPVSGFSRAKAQIDEAIMKALHEAAEARGDAPEKVEAPAHWVFHDLRRTAASGMAGLGIAPHVVEAALNHKSGTIKGVAAVYNRYNYATEKRTALEAWSRRVAAIVKGAEVSNVVELRPLGQSLERA